MRWECTECGSLVERHRRPDVCPFCGIGGAIFVHAGTDPEDGVLDASFREAWLDYGLNFQGSSLLDRPSMDGIHAA